MLMILLYPLACVGVLAAWLACAWKARSMNSAPAMTTALVALALCYGLGLAMISMNPWYDDNGWPEFIPWRDRWGWAAELAGWLAILVLPAALGLRALVRRQSRKA